MLAENGQRQSVSGYDKETTEELCVRAPAALQALGQLLLKSHIKKQKTNYFGLLISSSLRQTTNTQSL